MSTDAEATIGQLPQRMERSLQEQDRLTTTDARTVADALEQAAAPNTRRAYAGAWGRVHRLGLGLGLSRPAGGAGNPGSLPRPARGAGPEAGHVATAPRPPW